MFVILRCCGSVFCANLLSLCVNTFRVVDILVKSH